MTNNICFILLAVDKENNNDPLKIWGLYLFVLAFPGECVNQLGSEVKSIPERSAGWFKTLDVWHRLMLCDINKIFFLLIWSLELIKPYHKLLHNCHVSNWRPHHPDFEIFDGSRLTQNLTHRSLGVGTLPSYACHYLNLCWLDKVMWHSPVGNFTGNFHKIKI